MTEKVLSFGELLLRICPDTGGEWLRKNELPFYVGGAEANVATALGNWGIPSAYFTALPENLLSRQITKYLEGRNIDASRILYQGERIGLYFLPQGKDLKNAGVIYDRMHSSFAELQPGAIDWDLILRGVSWLHFTAISPALNSRAARICEEALAAAADKGIVISLDLNYRPKLWQYGAEPVTVMPGLAKYCDLIMGNLWAADKMLGVPVDGAISGTENSAAYGREDYLLHAGRTSEKIKELFPKVGIVANTFRFDRGAGGIQYYTTLWSAGEKKLYQSVEYGADKIVDKVGSGDCFMAGLVYGIYKGLSLQSTLDFATAAAFQKLFISSDATDQEVDAIEKFMQAYER